MLPILRRIAVVVAIGATAVAGARAADAQRGRGGMMRDEAHQADMRLFHALFDHREEIDRRVTLRPDGVETLTESSNPLVVKMLQDHVESMLARVKEARPIHQRDPLFREIFLNADRIVAHADRTPSGIRVVETSDDPYVAMLIQEHARVVSAFVENGRSEMMKNHEVPARPGGR